VWNQSGDLIAFNDDAPGGGNGSLVSLVDLEPNAYFMAIFDGFGTATSDFRVFQGVNPANEPDRAAPHRRLLQRRVHRVGR
jgi:hypothetical protein